MKTPSNITLNKEKDLLTITFDGIDYLLSSEYLRVYSPSAEVAGHNKGQEVLQIDKENVNIVSIKATGNYAVILSFSDGHNTGIYSWSHFYKLAIEKDQLWNNYLKRLKKAGYSHSQL